MHAETAPRNRPPFFVPIVYFLQAIPVALVQEVATVVYKDLGVANEPITRWTSIIALPWALQMLLGPLVDLNFRKRQWILGGQFAIAIGLILAAFAFATPRAFELSLVILGLTAFASAFCNIATDGFYMLAIPNKGDQATFAGFQSTFYRFGRLFCVFGLVGLSGVLMNRAGLSKPTAWAATFGAAALIYGITALLNARITPRPAADEPAVPSAPGENRANLARTGAVLLTGIGVYFGIGTFTRLIGNFIWQAADGNPTGPLKNWRLPVDKPEAFLTGFDVMTAQYVQLVASLGLIVAGGIWVARSMKGSAMGRAFSTFILQPSFPAILAFVVFYRFGEAMVSKMSPLFLKDDIAKGGLGFDNIAIAQIKGVMGVTGIILGGIVGGIVVSKVGLRKSIWPLAIGMHVPNLLYLWAAIQHPGLAPMYAIDFIDQFAYGVGYTAYTIILMRIAQRGEFKTSHFAIGTGMGALCIAIAGIVSGVIQQQTGYVGLFIGVMIMTIPGMLSLLFLPWRELEA